MLENNKKLSDRIKILGIGVKDDIYYVKYFKETFKVPFPLFPDKDRTIHEMVGEPATPFFIGLRFDKNRKEEIFLTNLGKLPGATEFIQMVVEKARLE